MSGSGGGSGASTISSISASNEPSDKGSAPSDEGPAASDEGPAPAAGASPGLHFNARNSDRKNGTP